MSDNESQPTASGGTLTQMSVPHEGDISSLTHAIVEWRKLSDEVKEYRQQIRERSKKIKALEEIILRVMKNHNIGALDLKASNGRLLYRKKQTKGSLSQKNLEGMLGECPSLGTYWWD